MSCRTPDQPPTPAKQTDPDPNLDQVRGGCESTKPHWDSNPRVETHWFDEQGCGPLFLDIRARMYSTHHAKYPVDDLTFRVMVEGTELGGIFIRPEDARELAAQMVRAADEADAELARLTSYPGTTP